MRTTSLVFLFAAFLFIAGAATVGAVPIQAGPHVVDVDCRNSANLLIPDARPSARVKGNNIVVSGSAPGYLSAEVTVPIAPGSFYYKTDLYLPDVPKKFYAIDQNRRPLKSVYFRTEQYGFSSDVYGITAFIPIKDWPNPGERAANVYDLQGPFGGLLPLAKSCTYEPIEGYYQVKLTLNRRTLDVTYPQLFVAFRVTPAKRAIEPMPIDDVIATLGRIQTAVDDGALEPEATTRALTEAADQCDLAALAAQADRLPPPMAAWVGTRQRFETLHRPEAVR